MICFIVKKVFFININFLLFVQYKFESNLMGPGVADVAPGSGTELI